MADQAKPTRIRLSRGRGWRLQTVSAAVNGLPAVKVTRPSRWGNPYAGDGRMTPESRAHVVALYREYLQRPEQADEVAAIREHLRGKNLACCCPLDGPCHADVLLELANGDA